MGVFYLLTLYCAIRALDGRHRAGWTTAAIAACALGMGSKEVMVSAPLIVWLWDWSFAAGRPRWPLYAGLAATWLVLALILLNEVRPHSVGALLGWTPWSYVVTQAGVVAHYLRLALVPTPLVLDYGWPRAASVVAVAPQAALLAGLLGLTVYGFVRRAPAAFLGAWFFAILAPSSSVLPIATEVAAEHRMYLPLAAVVTLVVVGGFALLRRFGARGRAVTAVAAVAVLIVVFGMMTRARNLDYRSEEAIWRDTVQKRPQNARARVAYGIELYRASRLSEAQSELSTAVTLDDASAAGHLNLGAVLCSVGKVDEGIAHLERAAALDPDGPEAYGNLGEAYASQGRMALAVVSYGRALDLRPDDPFLLNRLGWILATTPDDAVRSGVRAVDLAERAVRVTARRDAVSFDTLAAAYAETGRFDEAVAAAGEGLRLAQSSGPRSLVPEMSARLALYQQHRAFRQAAR
jgi:tetratricopeptide (TPR) repeat protein